MEFYLSMTVNQVEPDSEVKKTEQCIVGMRQTEREGSGHEIRRAWNLVEGGGGGSSVSLFPLSLPFPPEGVGGSSGKLGRSELQWTPSRALRGLHCLL